MHGVKVKICGITNLDDAKAAVDLGADMLGFNFHSDSPRYVDPAKVEKIIASLPGFVETVGLFVNANLNYIHEIANYCGLDWAQLHGEETPQFCEEFTGHSIRTMKAIRVQKKSDIQKSQKYRTDAILLDAWHPEKYGGTGKKFDWKFLEDDPGRDYFLAGGITADNVLEALQLGLAGIDICSGVEKSPGKKDPKKMKKLFESISDFQGGLTLYGYKL